MIDGHSAALDALREQDPAAKQAAVRALLAQQHALQFGHSGEIVQIPVPGRPARPLLVDPSAVKRRSLGSPEGRAAFIHAIAHIEFNAINLALDALYRFRAMPADYYADWLRVADDEARHFGWLRARLQELEHDYGDFPAHDGLWDMALRTDHDVMARMALVPRVLEARGLDVTPGMIERLEKLGDAATVAILERILAEEIPHVAIGSRWFHSLCAERALEPDSTFLALVDKHLKGRLKPPFNLPARRAAGFSETELNAVMALA